MSYITRAKISPEDTSANYLESKIIAGTNVTIDNNDSTLTINTTGEANTASNVGSTGDARVFSQKVGTDLEFRGIRAGTNISVTENGNDIIIDAFDVQDEAKSLYVDGNSTASGTPDGSSAHPFLTIQEAVNVATAQRNVIKIYPATYTAGADYSALTSIYDLYFIGTNRDTCIVNGQFNIYPTTGSTNFNVVLQNLTVTENGTEVIAVQPNSTETITLVADNCELFQQGDGAVLFSNNGGINATFVNSRLISDESQANTTIPAVNFDSTGATTAYLTFKNSTYGVVPESTAGVDIGVTTDSTVYLTTDNQSMPLKGVNTITGTLSLQLVYGRNPVKTSVVDTDVVVIRDSAETHLQKEVSFLNFKNSLNITSSLATLTDVQFATGEPTDGDILKYNGGASKWVSASSLPVVDIYTSTPQALTTSNEIAVANLGTAITFTLPTAVGIKGKIFRIKNIGVGLLTITPDGAETIDGTTLSLSQWESVDICSDGANWFIL